MGAGIFYYPADFNTNRFFLKWGTITGAVALGTFTWAYRAEQFSVYSSPIRPEWHSSYISDLEFNPPLWSKVEYPGTIPYIRTITIEETWDQVEKIRGTHWTDDYVYTKPWEVDDGQWSSRSESEQYLPQSDLYNPVYHMNDGHGSHGSDSHSEHVSDSHSEESHH